MTTTDYHIQNQDFEVYSVDGKSYFSYTVVYPKGKALYPHPYKVQMRDNDCILENNTKRTLTEIAKSLNIETRGVDGELLPKVEIAQRLHRVLPFSVLRNQTV